MDKQQAQSSCLTCSREQAGDSSVCWQKNTLVNYNNKTTTADNRPPQSTDGVDKTHRAASDAGIYKESLQLIVQHVDKHNPPSD